MKKEPLELVHKDLLAERLRAIKTSVAEYSFPNLFLFRVAHQYQVIFDEEIFIQGISYDGKSYLMPTFDVRSADIEYLKTMTKCCDFLFPIPEEWLSIFPPGEFDFSTREGEMDYIYTVKKMSTYPGRRLHKKRNLLKQFTTLYEHRAVPLTKDLIPDARVILSDWQAESGLGEDETDFSPCSEALTLYDDLILCGGIYYADGEPAGFILGEELDEETFALHFAKGRIKFTGVYQYMFNTFARILPAKYRFMNFEQDLDKETLRHAKSSYIPDVMLKKYRVSLKK